MITIVTNGGAFFYNELSDKVEQKIQKKLLLEEYFIWKQALSITRSSANLLACYLWSFRSNKKVINLKFRSESISRNQ